MGSRHVLCVTQSRPWFSKVVLSNDTLCDEAVTAGEF